MTRTTARPGASTLAATAGVLLALGVPVGPAHAAAPPALISSLQDVGASDGHRYGTADHTGAGMDGIKVIPHPQGGYLGVYHHLENNQFHVRVATSSDLLTWDFTARLEESASQPTIAALSDGGFVVAYEKHGPTGNCTGTGGCLGFEHFANVGALLTGASDRSIVLSRTLSACNEGTPNIYAATLNPDVDHSIINVGLHYHSGCDVDRVAVGTLTNFSSWRVQADANLNQRFTDLGAIKGNVGDRDAFHYQGRAYSVVEAQYTKYDYSSWRPYLFDRTSNSLTGLTLHTDAGSTSFGNPTYTDVVLPDRRRGFVSTQFIFSEGAGPTEAGELVYYRAFAPQPAPDNTSPSVAITQPANNAKVNRRASVNISATAADSSGVAKVAFYVNGVLTCVSPFPPYSCLWTVPNQAGVTYTLEARAFDTSSKASSTSVRVSSR
jgi:Big-like domain-containing protein